MNIDIAKTGAENLLALINSSNSATSLAIAANQVSLGSVSTFSGGVKPNLNSQVTVTAVTDAGYSGTKVVKFRRLTAAEAGDYTPGTPVTILPSDTEANVLTKICAALGLREADVELDGALDIPTSENNPTTIGVKGKDGSYLYLPSVTTITLTVPDTDIDLNDAIIVDELDGFDPAA